MRAKVINKDESVIYKNEIYSFDDEFEIDDAVGKSLIARGYIEGITDNPDLFEEDEVVVLGVNLDEMSYKELQKYAKELDLPANGSKDELVARIKEFLKGDEELDGVEEEEVGEEDSNDELPNTSMPE